jgi:hypothetical protein
MYEIKLTPSTKEEFETVAFVLKARQKENKEKPYKTVIHVEPIKTGSRLVATDGKRLHVAEIKAKIRSGEYKPTVTKESISFGEPVKGISYPEWNTVLPEKSRKRCVIDLGNTSLGKNRRETAALTVAFKHLMVKTGEVINLGYLEDLPKVEWSIYKEPGRLKVIVLKPEKPKKDALVVIMPMSIAA